ncbi:SAM-dependent methyltransferase [Streptomyces griseocarneus]|nr:SAM-dependent methyltransferase [Streptomyces griseocarneus]
MTDSPLHDNTALTDRAVLAGSAYRSGGDLASRQSLYQWQTPRYDLPGIVVKLLEDISGPVVDIGCGNGNFIRALRSHRPDLRLLGIDVSAGILTEVPGPVTVADAAQVPLADGSVNGALALHMLYHVKDIPRAISELGRILGEDGIVVASTNSEHDKTELNELWERAAGDVLGLERGPSRISLSSRFSLEEAPSLLGEVFPYVRVIRLPGTITVTDPDPVVAHMKSYRAWADQHSVPFEDTVRRAHDIVSAQIEREGRFTISCLGGLMICRKHASQAAP